MRRYKLIASLLVLFSNFAYSQITDSLFTDTILHSSIDTSLTDFELSFHDSISDLNQKSKIFSTSRAAYNSGLKLFNDNNFDDAIVSFTDAVIIDSTFSQAFFYRAKCYEEIDDSLSIIDYRIAYKLDTSNYESLYSLAKIQEIYSFEEAIKTYEFIISLSTIESKAYDEIGVLYYMQNNIEDAVEAFSKSLLINNNANTLNDRASCYRILNNIDFAINDYLLAISLNSELSFIYNNLASTYMIKGDTIEALRYYSLAITKDPNYVLAFNNRGSLYIDLYDFKSALSDINTAISIDPHYAPAYNNKGVIYHLEKKYVDALSSFSKAISLNNNYGKALLNRGITRQMTRDEDGACDDWSRANELGIKIANKYLSNDCN